MGPSTLVQMELGATSAHPLGGGFSPSLGSLAWSHPGTCTDGCVWAQLAPWHGSELLLAAPLKMLKGQRVHLVWWLPRSRGASLLVWARREKAVCSLVPPPKEGVLLPAVTPHVWLSGSVGCVSPLQPWISVSSEESSRGKDPEMRGDGDSLEGHAEEGGLGAATGNRSQLS